MKVRGLAAAVSTLLCLAACAAPGPRAAQAAAGAQGTGQGQDLSEARRLEKFAVAQCLMRAFPDTPVAADARRASGAYVELGAAQADVYEQIVARVQAWQGRPYPSKRGESLRVMQCLDLPDDAGLQELVAPYR
ncbi:T6SS amidase immunity protein Tai4 family protein [Orrella sp. JC864]|uniref:T6SS amidase immunity protein Tai4 family protein n=1 Tax=Orrella sp. JC864 TaxID=3120298 RepID=UPI0012BD4174